VVALIGDDQPVPGGQLGDVVAAGQGLQGDHVDRSSELGTAAAELPGLDAEELADPRPLLVSQGLAIDQDERGDLMGGNDRAGHDGRPVRGGRRRTLKIAATWPCAQHVVTAWQRVQAIPHAT
jgi:hypothetical protein